MSEVFRFIGFCGADDSVSPQLLKIISQHYNWIEWGVLFRTDLEGTARYASPQWVQELGRVQTEAGGSLHLAAHLCANRCQEILFGDFAFVKSISALGFRRAQVNATAANQVTVDPSRIAEYVSNIQLCIRSVSEIEWIIQCNEETSAIWTELVKDPQPNMSLLHDASCGKGVLVTSFPSPSLYPTIRCGYAGGIGPNTISAILENAALVVNQTEDKRPVWVDMESSLRTIIITNNATGEKKDTFSIDKCFNVVEKAVAFGLKPSM